MPKIKAYFASMADANKALNELKNQGFNNVFLDIIDKISPYDEDSGYEGYDGNSFYSLLTKSNNTISRNYGPFVGYDPALSNMSGYPDGMTSGTQLNVVAEGGNIQNAISIIRSYGGEV